MSNSFDLGDGEGDFGALLEYTTDADVPPQVFYDLLAGGQTDTYSTRRQIALVVFYATVHFEDVLQLSFRDSSASVDNFGDYLASV